MLALFVLLIKDVFSKLLEKSIYVWGKFNWEVRQGISCRKIYHNVVQLCKLKYLGGIMSKANKILKISLTLILLFLVIVVIIINKLKLDKPVFLMNSCEIETYGDRGKYSLETNEIKLKYISNVEDTRHVIGITFKDTPDINFSATEDDGYGKAVGDFEESIKVDKHGRYGVHIIHVTSTDVNYKDYSEEIMLSEAIIEFNDGSKVDVNLGKIILYKGKNDPVALENISSQTSNNTTSATAFTVNEDVIIEKIESPLLEETSEIFDFNISVTGFGETTEKKYEEGTKIKKDSIIICSSEYNGSEDILKDYNLYDIKPKISFTNDYDDRYSWRYGHMSNYYKEYTCYGLYKYLKARGEL